MLFNLFVISIIIYALARWLDWDIDYIGCIMVAVGVYIAFGIFSPILGSLLRFILPILNYAFIIFCCALLLFLIAIPALIPLVLSLYLKFFHVGGGNWNYVILSAVAFVIFLILAIYDDKIDEDNLFPFPSRGNLIYVLFAIEFVSFFFHGSLYSIYTVILFIAFFLAFCSFIYKDKSIILTSGFILALAISAAKHSWFVYPLFILLFIEFIFVYLFTMKQNETIEYYAKENRFEIITNVIVTFVVIHIFTYMTKGTLWTIRPTQIYLLIYAFFQFFPYHIFKKQKEVEKISKYEFYNSDECMDLEEFKDYFHAIEVKVRRDIFYNYPSLAFREDDDLYVIPMTSLIYLDNSKENAFHLKNVQGYISLPGGKILVREENGGETIFSNVPSQEHFLGFKELSKEKVEDDIEKYKLHNLL